MNFVSIVPSTYIPIPYYSPQTCLLFPEHLYYPPQPVYNLSNPQTPPPHLQPEEHVLENDVDIQALEENLQALHGGDKIYRKIHWTIQQDEQLKRLVQVQKLDWKDIPTFFRDRTQNMCYSRYRRITVCGKKRIWTREDEELVIHYVNTVGEKWKLISEALPKFTAKQIRERYLNALRMDLNKNEFNLEEDRAICQYVIANGKHWRKLEQLLPGRSEGSIKGRYYSKLCAIIQTSKQRT